MSAATNYLEDGILNHLLRTATLPKLSTVYLAVFTSPTDDTGGGTEVSGGSYAREPILVGDGSFTPTVAGTLANTNTIMFAFPTANWGTITHFAFYDAATGGNMLFHAALTAPVTIVSSGAPLMFVPNALTVSQA